MAAGKVDYDNLWKNTQYREKRIRWRKLRCFHNGAIILMFGYVCHNGEGPWFGFSNGMLVDVSCSHCLQVGVFKLIDVDGHSGDAVELAWRHHCPGHYNGKQLPCLEDHLCRGEPNMATAPMWSSKDFEELD